MADVTKCAADDIRIRVFKFQYHNCVLMKFARYPLSSNFFSSVYNHHQKYTCIFTVFKKTRSVHQCKEITWTGQHMAFCSLSLSSLHYKI